MYNNKIKMYRKESGLKLKDVAERCGISVGYLCHLEKGTRSNPSKEIMENIAIALDKTIQEIFFSN